MVKNKIIKEYKHLPTPIMAFQYDGTADMAIRVAKLGLGLTARFNQDGTWGDLVLPTTNEEIKIGAGDYFTIDWKRKSFFIYSQDAFELEYYTRHPAKEFADMFPTFSSMVYDKLRNGKIKMKGWAQYDFMKWWYSGEKPWFKNSWKNKIS